MDIQPDLMLLAGGGLLSGILAGLLGIGGGTILVPLIVTLGYLPKQAVATSSLAILITSTAGSLQNWRMGHLRPQKVLFLGLPALFTAQIGVFLANWFAPALLLLGFGLLLLLNIYLIGLRQSLTEQPAAAAADPTLPSGRFSVSTIAIGGIAGLVAGLFGLGGGVILVPLQVILLRERIKSAIQTSLGAIAITATFACISHARYGNVCFWQGMCLGWGGLLGVQASTRLLPKLPDRLVSRIFRAFMVLLAGYVFWQAWESYLNS